MIPSRRGYIFLQALIAVTALVALMAMLVANEKALMQNIQNRLRARRAEAAADAGLARALAAVEDANENVVGPNDEWAQLGDTGDEEFDLDPDSSFRVQVVDAGSLLNVNSATNAQLNQLPLEQDQVDCLLDWLQSGQTARSDGAKDSFYNSLPQPYNTKLGPLTTVDELMLVDNWTAQTLYQPPTLASAITMPTDQNGNTLPLVSLLTVDSSAPNTQASGVPRINISGATLTAAYLERALHIGPQQANLIAGTTTGTGRGPSGRRYSSFAQLLAVRGLSQTTLQTLLDEVTFTSPTTDVTGKLNLNTVSQPVLLTLPTLTPDIATSIVQQQQGAGFTSLGQLATVPGLTGPRLGLIAGNFVIGSDTWLVHVYGQSGGIGTAEEAVIGLRNGQAQVISLDRLHAAGIPTWWDWDAQVTSTADAGAVQ